MTIREAKQIVTINSVWEVYNLPGKPGNPDWSTGKIEVHLFPFMKMAGDLRILELVRMEM